MNIVGISAFFHDAACCLLKDGVLVAAAEEERFTRIKADPSAPGNALKYCLKEAGLTIGDVDCIAYYEDPEKKLARQLWSGILGNSPAMLKELKPHFVEEQIRDYLGFDGMIKYVDHHLSHAASAYYFSGFDDAAIFTVDGVGEWATTTYATGIDNRIEIFEEVEFPDSLGLLYSTITSYLGFGVNDGEYKVMGLAPYGKPLYNDKIRQLIQTGHAGQYMLDMQYFSFLSGHSMFSPRLIELFDQPARMEDAPMAQFHMDVARSLQEVLEEVLIEKSNYLFEKANSYNLCMAGGVALNCVANGKILKHSNFKRLFVQPAANDAGGCLGAAAYVHSELTGKKAIGKRMEHVYLGPSFSNSYIKRLLDSTSILYTDCNNDDDRILHMTADRLQKGQVIGWFQGRMEFGPRSLGSRSILADPRNPEMRERINAMVKKREGFRPFAPAVIDSKAADHFDIDHISPFMLETCQVISPLSLPAITHVDGSARLQTVHRDTNKRFHDLLSEFERMTGCPILLNTSFNVKGEPIVCTPEDCLSCFITTDIDCIVIGDYIIDRKENDFDMLELFVLHDQTARWESRGITHDVYTFL
jgi:carbamoyltransferase